MKNRYIWNATVRRIEERKMQVWLSGTGDNVQFEERSTGWWLTIDNVSPTSFCLGAEKPSCKIGDNVKITLEVG